jgi:Fe-S-cluster containining protein
LIFFFFDEVTVAHEKIRNETQTECRQCGTCCLKGGPALHTGDLDSIRGGQLPLNRLITIRKGELVSHPLTGRVLAVERELVKICGTGGDWRCFYFSTSRGCTIYASRPIACRVLKCWDPTEISAIVGKDTLTRLDILAEGDPLRPLVAEHERLCPCPDMELIRRSLASGSLEGLLDNLQRLVNADLSFRNQAVKDHDLSLAEELFYFGRPIFQLLQMLGVEIAETAKGIRLSLSHKR